MRTRIVQSYEHIEQYEDTKRIQQYEGAQIHSEQYADKYENTHKTHSSMQIHMPKYEHTYDAAVRGHT